MNEYPGCQGCIHNENQEWYVTNDFTQVCHHDPHPSNLGAVREGDESCEFYEPEKYIKKKRLEDMQKCIIKKIRKKLTNTEKNK